jgi:hypothetical protein
MNAGFMCGKAAVLKDKIKETPGKCERMICNVFNLRHIAALHLL